MGRTLGVAKGVFGYKFVAANHRMCAALSYAVELLSCCSSSGFPCVGVRLVYSSLRCTATFVIRFHWSLLLAFSLHSTHTRTILEIESRRVFRLMWAIM